MSLKIVKRVLELEVGDEVFKLRFPTADELIDFSEKSKEAENDMRKSVALSRDLIVNVGLKESVAKELELADLTHVVNALSEEKKI